MAIKDRIRASISRTATEQSPLLNIRKEVAGGVKSQMDVFKAEIVNEILSKLDIETVVERVLTSGVREQMMPKKGVHYNDGIPGMPGKDGAPGRDGMDAPSMEQIEKLVKLHLKKAPKTKEFQLDLKALAKDIARSLETLKGSEKLDYYALKNIPGIDVARAMEKSYKGGGGGGMGQPQHETTATSSATTTVTTTYRIAANGRAAWVYYQGQFLLWGVHYTVGSDRRTLTFTFTLTDNTNIDITYFRG